MSLLRRYSIIFQCFESIAGRYLEIVKKCRPVQLGKFAERRSFNVRIKV
jgi:hypothetical protein